MIGEEKERRTTNLYFSSDKERLATFSKSWGIFIDESQITLPLSLTEMYEIFNARCAIFFEVVIYGLEYRLYFGSFHFINVHDKSYPS